MMLGHKRIRWIDVWPLVRVVASGAAFVALLLLAGCEEPAATPIVDDPLAEMGADYQSYGIEQVMTVNGVRDGVVRADSTYVFGDSTTANWGVEMILYFDTGRERARVTADRAEIRNPTNPREENSMVARGNVVVRLADGQRIESEELHYDPGDRTYQIWSDSASVLTQTDDRVTRGTCFKSNLEFTEFDICEPRGAVFTPGMTAPDTASGGRVGPGGTTPGGMTPRGRRSPGSGGLR